MYTIEKFNTWISTSITVKMLSVGVLILLLLIPKSMVTSLIREREHRMEQAMKEITGMWPGSQKIVGPVVTVPYNFHYEEEEELKTVVKYAHFLPEQLNVQSVITPEERYRGIYKVIVYKSGLSLKGTFLKPDFSPWDIMEEDVIWEKAKISLGIKDLRGLQQNVDMKWNGQQLHFEQGLANKSFIGSGIKASLKNLHENEKYSFEAHIALKGSQGFFLTPVGKETNVQISGAWPDPKFTGSFLPDPREINEEGFSAQWKVLHFNRSFPQQWLGDPDFSDKSFFGVELFQSAGHYQKTERTAKYAILIIALTFLVFFLAEVITKIRIHPFQYILVGLTLCLFYTLLLSISEHLGFDIAYALAALAIVVLVSWYSKTFFRHKRAGMQMSVTLSFFYAFMYVIVRLEDYSLLVGSVGLLLILALLMYLTRKINWYKGIPEAS